MTSARHAAHFSSVTPEWYTPQSVIAVVLEVMSGIDLDPCSNIGTPNIPAHHHLTIQDDGLSHRWYGRVYMNPPYGRRIGQWVDKLIGEHRVGRVREAIALLPSRTDTRWFERLGCADICFVRRRIKFSDADNNAPFPSMFAYLGGDGARFAQVFSSVGIVYARRYSTATTVTYQQGELFS